jgi:tetratricopeptide (TPR) repeat protein
MRRYCNEIVVCLALAVLTLGTLGHVCWNGFINYDDGDYVVRNAQVKAGLNRAGLLWAFTTTHAANWHPLTWLSLQTDASVYGPDAAWGDHLTNLLLHTANVVLLFLALRRMTRVVWRSAVVAALFAVHPAQVESVAWVAERKDVLSGLFWMLTLLAYAWYAERPGWRRYLPVLTTFALGLMAKPMLVTLPCVLLLLDYWPLNRLKSETGNPKSEGNPNTEFPITERPSSWDFRFRVWHFLRISDFVFRIFEKLPLFALTAAACVMTVYAQHKGGAINTLEQMPLGERLMNSVAAYAGYLGDLVWPSGLAPYYPHPGRRLLLGQAVRAGLVLAAITALVLWARRRRYLAVGWFWFLGTLVPVIGLVQVGSQAMADRYTYLPYIGLFIALTWGAADLATAWPASLRAVVLPAALLVGVWVPLALWFALGVGAQMMEDHVMFLPVAVLTGTVVLGWGAGWLAGLWPNRLSPLAPLTALLIGVCAALSVWQARVWHNSIWLWEYAVAVTRDSATGHNNLGDAYWNSRHPERVERARDNYVAALRILPQHARAHNNLGLVYLDQGQLEEAGAHFKEARTLDPELSAAVFNEGRVLARQGRFEEAVEQFEAARRQEPGDAVVSVHLGRALAGLGRWEEAAGAFRRAVQLEPRQKDFRADLAWAVWHLGQKEASAIEYAAVVEADAEWPETARERAEKLATNPTTAQRSGFDAVRLAEEACQARGGNDRRFLDTQEAAYAELRRGELR